jgi:hypothetical protein
VLFARSVTYKARLESIDAGIDFVRDELMPMAMSMPGCMGLSMMADRHGGRVIATTSWESMDRMRASSDQIRPMRERGGEVLGGAPFVEEWEVAVVHRDHPTRTGACMRCTWFRIDPMQIDRVIETFRMGAMPAMESLSGFCSASLFVNREMGRAVSNAVYDSMDTMARSREGAKVIRVEAARDAQADVLDVCEFELAIAHLRIPEMA